MVFFVLLGQGLDLGLAVDVARGLDRDRHVAARTVREQL